MSAIRHLKNNLFSAQLLDDCNTRQKLVQRQEAICEMC